MTTTSSASFPREARAIEIGPRRKARSTPSRVLWYSLPMASPDTGRPRKGRQATLAELRARIDDCMRRRGLHFTEPRRLIIDEFLASSEHFTLDDMAARVREKNASVGFSTVYRTLRLLVECGVAEEHHFGDKLTRYEIAELDAHHDHLVCTVCGKIFEFCEPR